MEIHIKVKSPKFGAQNRTSIYIFKISFIFVIEVPD